MTKMVDYFFSIGSPWSYLGLDAFLAAADRYSLKINPYISTLIEENGGLYSRDRPEPRRNYWFKDLRRWANFRGIEMMLDNRPVLVDPTPASFSVIAHHLDSGDWIMLTRALQQAFWRDGSDIGRPEVRRAIADRHGIDGARLLSREADDDVQKKWATDRRAAVTRGVFGFPTYGYGEEIYWGQDSLPFLERAVQSCR